MDPLSRLETISIANIPISKANFTESVNWMINAAQTSDAQIWTATPNAEILLETNHNLELKNYLQKCDLNTPDSISLLWAAAYLDQKWSKIRAIFEVLFCPWRQKYWQGPLSERVSGSDLFVEFCHQASKTNLKLFLAGGQGGVSKKTAEIMQEKFPGLRIVGAIDGSPKPEDSPEMIKVINESQAEVLFLAYGCPKQELWIMRHLIDCPQVKLAMGIGGTFNFVAGKLKRAPLLWRKLNLEWFWRLLLEPSRWRRIWRAVMVFPFYILSGQFNK
ncbi:MAG TPA: WecB/TagA/CpsF family glycosyltransferase [Candidatus Gracilibacteria bacterium]|nr:WecB/TagA/CpsF family glycosyltransferase [Candidatus Gracilibacteria bacterium]